MPDETAAVSFKNDILPLFRQTDVTCMNPYGVILTDYKYMSDADNAANVYDQLDSGAMPKDGAWPPAKIQLFKQWMDGGYQP